MKHLTDYEIAGLQAELNLADGHAYHSLEELFSGITQRLPEIWDKSDTTRVSDAQDAYLDAFGRLIGSDTLRTQVKTRISPTSSNSIDIVSAFLNLHARRVVLVEPTFDNLALLLRRRGCALTALSEDHLFAAVDDDSLLDLIDPTTFDALFLVNPNNPTGAVVTEAQFKTLVAYCAKHNKLLVLDATFRFYNKARFDEYKILADNGGQFIVIEDTGKTWPTHDMKASLLAYQTQNDALLETIFDEIYLCHSRFTLGLFTHLFDQTAAKGIETIVHHPIAKRHAILKAALAGLPFPFLIDRAQAEMPIEWIGTDSLGNRACSMQVDEMLRASGVHVLPGQHFYWNDPDRRVNRIRVSLAKPHDQVVQTVDLLGKILAQSSQKLAGTS